MLALLEKGLGPLVRRMWPSTFHGLENLPDHDRYMVVANHSGMGAAELWSLTLAWYEERFGPGRRVAGMAHPTAFRVPGLGDVLRGVGAVEATRTGAARARHHGVPLLLFPGGDQEATRPFWEASRVDFAGRKGWIHLAREHGLTIIPMCITGSHNTLPIVGGGRAVAWATGLRLLGVHQAPIPLLSVGLAAGAIGVARRAGASLPITLGAAWIAWMGGLMIPWLPSTIGFHVLPPISSDELVDPAEDAAIYQRVIGSIEAVMRAHAP